MKPLTHLLASLCLICSHILYAADDPALIPPVINTAPHAVIVLPGPKRVKPNAAHGRKQWLV